MTRPNIDFLVIGAQKCATTWLFKCLKEHSSLHLPAKKKEHEFLGGDLYEERGADWFFSLLEGGRPGQRIGAVSVEYLYDARAPGVVHSCAPEVRLIASLRNPVDRAVSAYFWCVRKGLIPQLSLDEGLRHAVAVYHVGLNGQSSDEDRCYYELIARGLYADQLERYLAENDSFRLMIINYDDIKRSPGEVLGQVWGFLDVPDDFIPRAMGSRPKQNSYLGLLVFLEKYLGNNKYTIKLLDILNQGVDRLGGKRNPVLPTGLREALREIYIEPNRDLQQLLSRIPERHKSAGFKAGLDW